MTSQQRSFCQRVLAYQQQLPIYPVISNNKQRFSISVAAYPAGAVLPLVSLRQAIFEGKPPCKITLPQETTIYSLHDQEHGTWMTTNPQEIGQLDEGIRKIKGRVLIGGLGLGVISQLLAHKDNVNEITTIEREPELIKLIKPVLHPKIKVIEADLFAYLPTIKPRQYQYAYFDIWQGTGEWVWQTQVVPLRRLAAQKIKHIFCWQEEVMHGQIAHMLYRSASLDAALFDKQPSTQHYWVFRQALPAYDPKYEKSSITKFEPNDFQKLYELEQSNRQDPNLRKLVALYLTKVGSPLWESLFGKYWDETLTWA